MARYISIRVIGVVALFSIAILGILAAQLVTASIPATTALTAKAQPAAEQSAVQDTQPAADQSAVQDTLPAADQSVAMMPSPPRSLEAFVQQSQVIVIGRISRFTSEGLEGPYPGSKIPTTRTGGPNPPKFPFSYFDLEIIEVIANPRSVPLSSSVVIRAGGRYTTRSETRDPPFYEEGDENLFALVMNPDGTFGTSFGSWGRLNIDGDIVTFANRARTPIKFTDQTSPDAFIQAVKEEAAKQ